MDFDAFDLCTPELQEKLAPMRAKFKEFEDAQVDVANDRNKSRGDGKPKENKKFAPYWFEDGTIAHQ